MWRGTFCLIDTPSWSPNEKLEPSLGRFEGALQYLSGNIVELSLNPLRRPASIPWGRWALLLKMFMVLLRKTAKLHVLRSVWYTSMRFRLQGELFQISMSIQEHSIARIVTRNPI
jgi:hypothetical protein